MEKYSEHQPTAFDRHLRIKPCRDHWYVFPMSITRDTDDAITLSNWEIACKELKPDETPGCEIHRFGHWGPGWYEIILIHPLRTDLIAIAEDMERALEGYPVLDDLAYSEKCNELIQKHWESWGDRELQKFLEEYFSTEETDYEMTDKEYKNLKELIQQKAHYDILDDTGNLDLKHVEYLLNKKITQEEIDTIETE